MKLQIYNAQTNLNRNAFRAISEMNETKNKMNNKNNTNPDPPQLPCLDLSVKQTYRHVRNHSTSKWNVTQTVPETPQKWLHKQDGHKLLALRELR